MTRSPLISGNWKMNLNHFEAIQTVQKLSYLVPRRARGRSTSASIRRSPTSAACRRVIESDDFDFHLGAQHCHWEESGALHRRGVAGVPRQAQRASTSSCGHSRAPRDLRRDRRDGEPQGRRHPGARHDADPVLRRDARRARGGGDRDRRCSARSRPGSPAARNEQVASLVIAYEPIWAIGTGMTATADDAQAVCAAIRGKIRELSDDETAEAVRIQYGGSVKAANAAELMAQPDIDGALVGGASLDPDEFAKIVQFDT